MGRLSSTALRFPPPLRPGDTVAVFAGSSPFPPTLAWRGLAWLRTRYRVRFDRSLFDRHGFLAGDDPRRLTELAAWMADPDVRAVLAVRGGYGLSRIAPALPWEQLRRDPKWIVGFSDVTTLHVEAARVGVASVHGPMVASLGRGDDVAREAWRHVLEHPTASQRFEGLDVWVAGTVEGPLYGGNLTLLHACATAGRLRIPPGSILVLEDVGERPYRIDRMLTTLQLGGHVEAVAGVMVGQWTDCAAGPDGVSVKAVLRERLERWGVPVLSGAPVGHGPANVPVVLGRCWRLATDPGTGFGHAETLASKTTGPHAGVAVEERRSQKGR